MDMYTLPGVELMAGGGQPRGTARSARCFVTAWGGGREGHARGRRCGDVCVCIADSLCCKAEANTPLSSNCTPTKMLKKKRMKR